MIQPTSTRVYIFLGSTDMRKSYNTLSALATNAGFDPTAGDLFVFTNRNRNRFKILLWEGGGYWLCCKRLEVGVFAIPSIEDKESQHTIKINFTELRLLIEGIELKQVKKTKRFEIKNA